VGLYGVLFHVVVTGVVAWVGHRNQAGIPGSFWVQAVPPFLVAALAVYALVVAPYVPRRSTTKGAVFFDSAVGMFAEAAVFVLAAFLYAALVSAPAFGHGLSAYATAVASTTFFGILWAFGSFFLQILVVGNAAGLVGWWVLKKIAARHPRHAPA
jgi:hypothetical protein